MTVGREVKNQPAESNVRSIAEIRGRYGLAEEHFEALPEGDRDRQTGTVTGRKRQREAKKFVATEQAVMGTARLEVPAQVRSFQEEPVSLPLRPLRWWPLIAAAMLTPGLLFVKYFGMSEEPATVGSPGSAIEEKPAGALGPAPVRQAADTNRGTARTIPHATRNTVQSYPARRVPSPSGSAAPVVPASASAVPVRENQLPDFPDLEEP